jgi:hypothetical protein
MITKKWGRRRTAAEKKSKILRNTKDVSTNILILKYFHKRVDDLAVTWPVAQYFIIRDTKIKRIKKKLA